ncbi:hypothetical protein CHS0354_003054 [Potamilus streckersoni]|uniref:Uncharacterized protein n=1 Tax=Potamilus streckersoni TaxID=2493646 RepID=A0AAE0TBR1_9BIVA|nr:hypothetical protein CHS0354_003054 [Potamilus streckersoni]
MNVKDEKLDELKEEAYAEEENQVEDNTFQLEKRFWLMKHSVELMEMAQHEIKKLMEMAQHEIKKDTIDPMTNVEEEEGSLMIVKDIEMQKQDEIITFVAEDAEIETEYSVVCQKKKVFSQQEKEEEADRMIVKNIEMQ